MAYAQHLPHIPRRSPVLGLIVLFHAILIYYVNLGLRIEIPRIPPDLQLVNIEPIRERPVEPTPPPEPKSDPTKKRQVVEQEKPTPVQVVEEPVETAPVIDVQPVTDSPRPEQFARTSPATDPRNPITRPPYPPQAIRMEQEGLVVINACVRPDGQLTDLGLARSSGYPILDQAALRHLGKRGTRLLPGTEDGRPVMMCTQVPIRFSIEDR